MRWREPRDQPPRWRLPRYSCRRADPAPDRLSRRPRPIAAADIAGELPGFNRLPGPASRPVKRRLRLSRRRWQDQHFTAKLTLRLQPARQAAGRLSCVTDGVVPRSRQRRELNAMSHLTRLRAGIAGNSRRCGRRILRW